MSASKNKRAGSGSKPVSEKVFKQTIEKVLTSIIDVKTHLESKIEYSRKDFGEQLRSVQKGLNTRMDGFDKRMDGFDKRMDVLNSELKSTQEGLKAVNDDLSRKIDGVGNRLSEKLDRYIEVTNNHEVRITALESAN